MHTSPTSFAPGDFKLSPKKSIQNEYFFAPFVPGGKPQAASREP